MPVRTAPGCIYSLKPIREAAQRAEADHSLAGLLASPHIRLASDGAFIFYDPQGPVCAFWGIQAGGEMLRLEQAFPGIVRLYMTSERPDEEPQIIAAREAWHAYYLSAEDNAMRLGQSRPSKTPKARAAMTAEKRAYAKSLFDI